MKTLKSVKIKKDYVEVLIGMHQSEFLGFPYCLPYPGQGSPEASNSEPLIATNKRKLKNKSLSLAKGP